MSTDSPYEQAVTVARVLLQPRGSNAVRGHVNFRKAIIDGVDLARVLPYVSAPDAVALRRLEQPLRLWDSTSTDQQGNEKARALAERRVGDHVFFYAENTFVARGRIAHVFDNAALADSIWDRDWEGRPWQHMMALTDLEPADRPGAPLLAAIGRQPIVRGLALLSDEDSARFLAAWDGAPEPAVEAREILRELVGVTIETVTGMPNRVLGFDDRDNVVVATRKSPAGAPVPVVDVQRALDRLRRERSLRVDVAELGHRSAFVAAVLKTLPDAVVEGPPWRIVVADGTYVGGSPSAVTAETDGRAEVRVRLEQERLRRLALDGRSHAECALCGSDFAAEFLIAAHIKRRAACTDEERNDFANIVMLACAFGCDVLYEKGYVSVDATGTIVVAPSALALPGPVASYVERLRGRRCSAYSDGSAEYFGFHVLSLRP